MTTLRDVLQTTGWFKETELQEILSCFSSAEVKKKAHILHEGELCKRVVFVEEGCFRTYTIDRQLHESVVYFGFEGWWLSDLDSLENQVQTIYNIQALEDSRVCTINRDDFFTLMDRFPKFKEGHIQLVRKSYAAMMVRIREMRFKSVEERYLDLLERQPEVLQRIPQLHIAAYLGVEPQSLSRLRKRIFGSNRIS